MWYLMLVNHLANQLLVFNHPTCLYIIDQLDVSI